MSNLFRVQRFLYRYASTRVTNVWTPENIVKSPYTDVDIPNITFSDYLWKNLDRWPDKTAAICGISNRAYSYHKLYQSSRNFAATIRTQMQIKDGDVIAIMMPNTLEYPIVVIGAIHAGAVVAPINPAYTANELHIHLQHSKPKLIISSVETIGIIKEAFQLAKAEIPIIVSKDYTQSVPSGVILLDELFNNENIDKSILKDVKRKPEDVVLLPYSSGTTGLSKGVELTNRNKVANYLQQSVEGVKHHIETTSQHQDSIMAVIPFYHIYGLSVILLHKLSIGAKLVILPKFQPQSYLNAIRKHKIGLVYSAPPLVQFLGTHPAVTKEHLESLDRLVCATAPISETDIHRLFYKSQADFKFIQVYGLTEVSPFATSMVPGSRAHTTVGFALPNTELRVVGSNERNLGPDEVGELYIRGPQVMKGYKDNPKATKDAITDDGWFRTGDLVSINREGAVTVVDRIKELIKVKGYQVPPAELEALLKQHPDIQDVAVIGIPDLRSGEVPKAFVVLKEGHKTTAINIKEFVSKQVAEYKWLKAVEFVDDLPRNSTGKLLKRVLRDREN